MKFRLSLAVLLGVFVWAFAAYPDCHDTADCEDVEEYVVGDYYWGTHEETYRYYIDPDKSGMPSLTADVDAAADNWDRILFKGARLNFATHNKGRTTRDAGVEDGVNVISWEDLGDEDDDPLGLAYRWAFIGTYLLKEVDIAFNYYHDWATHANRQSGKYCIRNTATHEMGHAAGLDDVYYYPSEPSGEGNCPHWERYTMHGISGGPNTHNKISLECEDKWALWRKYGHVDP